jgi:hypothetical protein
MFLASVACFATGLSLMYEHGGFDVAAKGPKCLAIVLERVTSKLQTKFCVSLISLQSFKLLLINCESTNTAYLPTSL